MCSFLLRVEILETDSYYTTRLFYVDQTGLEHRDLPAAASRVLGLTVPGTVPSPQLSFTFRAPLWRVNQLMSDQRNADSSIPVSKTVHKCS